jgi:hypothetical protein
MEEMEGVTARRSSSDETRSGSETARYKLDHERDHDESKQDGDSNGSDRAHDLTP